MEQLVLRSRPNVTWAGSPPVFSHLSSQGPCLTCCHVQEHVGALLREPMPLRVMCIHPRWTLCCFCFPATLTAAFHATLTAAFQFNSTANMLQYIANYDHFFGIYIYIYIYVCIDVMNMNLNKSETHVYIMSLYQCLSRTRHWGCKATWSPYLSRTGETFNTL